MTTVIVAASADDAHKIKREIVSIAELAENADINLVVVEDYDVNERESYTITDLERIKEQADLEYLALESPDIGYCWRGSDNFTFSINSEPSLRSRKGFRRARDGLTGNIVS